MTIIKKHFTALICSAALLTSSAHICYARSQYDIYTAIDSARGWMEKNSSPFSRPEAPSSDYYMMALSRLGAKYDYKKFLSYTTVRKPSTTKDGQRLILSATACGGAPDYVNEYTYDVKQFNDISELAGAIISIDSGEYEFDGKEITKEQLIAQLLASQQSDGKFGTDAYTTALSVIALTPYCNTQYKLTGSHKNNVVSYNTMEMIEYAVEYLKTNHADSGGFPSIRTNAHLIMALDSIGMDADNDIEFIVGGNSPVGRLLAQQRDDGSFNSSADDTALALCAMTSHLRAMQNKSGFFNFRATDAPETASDIDCSGQGMQLDPDNIRVVEVESINFSTNNDTKDHSAANEEKTGEQNDTKETETASPTAHTVTENKSHAALITVLIVLIILILSCISAYVILRLRFLGKKKERQKTDDIAE